MTTYLMLYLEIQKWLNQWLDCRILIQHIYVVWIKLSFFFVKYSKQLPFHPMNLLQNDHHRWSQVNWCCYHVKSSKWGCNEYHIQQSVHQQILQLQKVLMKMEIYWVLLIKHFFKWHLMMLQVIIIHVCNGKYLSFYHFLLWWWN